MRRIIPRLLVATLTAVAFGCGGDGRGNDGRDAEDRRMNETPRGDCGNLGQLRLEIVSGGAPCDVVREVAAGYDLQGAKVQEVSGWMCESGEAATRPIVFTCTRGDTEFVAKEADG